MTTDFDEYSLKFKNFKCFGEPLVKIDDIEPINIVIGKNNSGKSTFLDVIQYLTSPERIDEHGNSNKKPQIYLEKNMAKRNLKSVFSDRSGDPNVENAAQKHDISFSNNWDFGQEWIGQPIIFRVEKNKKHTFIRAKPNFELEDGSSKLHNLANHIKNPFIDKEFIRLESDRNIEAEKSTRNLNVKPTGEGCTNLIQTYLTEDGHPRNEIKKKLKKELNLIFKPDGKIEEILTQYNRSEDEWEIYLRESDAGDVPLTHVGSGLKTIILVLVKLHIVPTRLNCNYEEIKSILCCKSEFRTNRLFPLSDLPLIHHLSLAQTGFSLSTPRTLSYPGSAFCS